MAVLSSRLDRDLDQATLPAELEPETPAVAAASVDLQVWVHEEDGTDETATDRSMTRFWRDPSIDHSTRPPKPTSGKKFDFAICLEPAALQNLDSRREMQKSMSCPAKPSTTPSSSRSRAGLSSIAMRPRGPTRAPRTPGCSSAPDRQASQWSMLDAVLRLVPGVTLELADGAARLEKLPFLLGYRHYRPQLGPCRRHFAGCDLCSILRGLLPRQRQRQGLRTLSDNQVRPPAYKREPNASSRLEARPGLLLVRP